MINNFACFQKVIFWEQHRSCDAVAKGLYLRTRVVSLIVVEVAYASVIEGNMCHLVEKREDAASVRILDVDCNRGERLQGNGEPTRFIQSEISSLKGEDSGAFQQSAPFSKRFVVDSPLTLPLRLNAKGSTNPPRSDFHILIAC